jgi:hypothetical protein
VKRVSIVSHGRVASVWGHGRVASVTDIASELLLQLETTSLPPRTTHEQPPHRSAPPAAAGSERTAQSVAGAWCVELSLTLNTVLHALGALQHLQHLCFVRSALDRAVEINATAGQQTPPPVAAAAAAA